MKKTLLILTLSLFFIQANSQNVDLNNTTDYIRVQKSGESNYTRAFGLNGTNQLYIGSIEKPIGNIYFFNKGTNHLMTLNPAGNVGIGTTNPGAKLDILSNAGQTESLMRFKISDAPSDYLQIANSTGSANQFIPLIKGYHATDNRYSLSIMGSTSDAMDTGTNALVAFDARRSNGPIQNRPLFTWTSYTTKMMTMAANGNLGIGTTNPNAKLHIVDQGNSSVTSLQLNNRIKFRGDGVITWGSSADHGRLSWDTNKAIIGGQTGKDLSLLAGGGEKMIVKTNGNVGIGTTNPTAELEVKSIANNNAEIHINSSTDGKPSIIRFQDAGQDSWGLLSNYPTVGKFSLYNYNNNSISMLADTNGNIGIGTTNPQEKLDVKGKIFLNSGPDDDGIYWARHNMTMGTIPGSYNHNVFMLKPGGSSSGFLHSKFEMYTADSETEKTKKVQIHSYGTSFFNGGNVGIGTEDTKGFKLGVKGKIAAEEVKVALYNAWPDYVFENDYNLPTLQEVENHIAEKGHLENVPSATEVSENGIQLGEMNAKLLQKIEELTLYMIEQNKKTENLIKEVEALKLKNTELEQKIK
ncbi:hypothetical protein [uncultured Aquimarina sp.]|uniref:hypothetical protein n=1 Tax=uncultured Aquimarina sp. TaxID=575652 RepID=UPI0026233FA2|nr:hypothetical protein [uncultured Aquimarina sp.]